MDSIKQQQVLAILQQYKDANKGNQFEDIIVQLSNEIENTIK